MALLASAALLAGALVARAGATHIPGATYNGNIQGGGTISFTVNAEGSGISSLSTTGPIQGDICTFSGSTTNYIQPLAITNHAFSDTSPPVYFAGSFSGPQGAQGTLRLDQGGCDTGNLSWTATTTAQPPGPGPGPGPGPSARCDGKAATIVGSGASQTLNGTPGRDVIAALGGSDTVRGGGGNDVICAGAGNDIAAGGGGNDVVLGQGGRDTLRGGGGRDRLRGGAGRDVCAGGGGKDSADCEVERTV